MAGSGKHRKGHSMKTLHSLHVMERLGNVLPSLYSLLMLVLLVCISSLAK